MKSTRTLAVLALALGATACARNISLSPPVPSFGGAPPVIVRETAQGQVLATNRGMTLYIYDQDRFNRSVCFAGCAEQFPPLRAEPGAQPSGDYTLVARDDGAAQWAHRGRPLYTFSGDPSPGDVAGTGAGPAWRLARY